MGILTEINWIDIVNVIILIRISYVALQDGLSHEIFPLIGTVISAAVSIRYYHDITLRVQEALKVTAPILDLLAFVALVAFIGLIIRLLKMAVDAIVKVTWHPFVEKFGGLLSGVLRGAIIVSIVLTIMMLTTLPYLQYSVKEKSYSGSFFLKVAPRISESLAWAMPQAIVKK